MKRLFLIILIVITHIHKIEAQESDDARKKRQEAIVTEYLTNCAEKHNYIYKMAEWQNCLDEGLKKDSTIARLWQEKAMPYFKARKYEVGMKFVDKAVVYNRKEYLPYRAFIKCIFSKEYKSSIIDFEAAKKEFGNSYIMDHTYGFYIGLSYLQLNEYAKAEKFFKDYIDDIFKNRQGLEHPTALFYLGIAKYEQRNWNDAIIEFDKAIKLYPNFSDAEFYKAVCLGRLKRNDEVEILYKKAKEDAKLGYSINEYNTVYETYPYQVKWKD
jgi:tetratricopeptide (TPR) repeat protein